MNRKNKIVFFILPAVLWLGTVRSSFGQASINDVYVKPGDWSLTYDSGYPFWNLTFRSRLNLLEDVENANTVLFYAVEKGFGAVAPPAFARTLSFFAGGFANLYVHDSFVFISHEYAHRSRSLATGAEYGWVESNEENPVAFYFETLLDFRFNGTDDLGSTEDLGMRFKLPKDNPFVYDPPETGGIANSKPRWARVSAAAGFTSDMKLSGYLANRMHQGRAKTTDFISYSWDKLFPYFYKNHLEDENDTTADGLGDVARLSQLSREFGRFISRDEIARASVNAYLLSFSTYAYLRGIRDYFQNGENRPKPFVWKGWRLPDVQVFYERGISYKILTGYSDSPDLELLLEYETVVKGESQREFTLVLKSAPKEQSLLTLKWIFGKAQQGGVEYYSAGTNPNWYLGGDHQNVDNLEGMRNIYSLRNLKSSTEYYAGLRFRF